MINVAMVGLSLGSSVSPVSVPRCSGKTAAGKASASVTSTVTQEGFQVRKRFLRPAQIVAAAAAMAEDMLRKEARCPDYLPNAMERLERRHALPARTFWSLRYRQPKRLFADVYLNLHLAYQAECARQQKALVNDISATAALVGTDHALVRAAASLGGEDVPLV